MIYRIWCLNRDGVAISKRKKLKLCYAVNAHNKKIKN